MLSIRYLFALVIILSCPTFIYAAPGDLDASFGGVGWVSPGVGGLAKGNSVIQQADGKLVVAGSVGYGGAFALARYNAAGVLDTTFNSTGTLIVSTNSDTASVIQQADGKLVVVSMIIRQGSNFALERYNPDGALDTTFDEDGKLTTPVGIAKSVIQQADGKLVVAGLSYTGTNNSDFVLVRYNLDGALDTTFNGTGTITTAVGANHFASATSVIQQADGKLVAVGYSYNGSTSRPSFSLVRYNADGSLDTTFNVTGKVITATPMADDFATSVIQQADGKLVAAGYSYKSSTGKQDFALVRYNIDGSLDTTFNGTGKFTTAMSAGTDYATSLVQQADGKLVVVGFSDTGSRTDFALARYNTDGSLDTTFSGDGKLIATIGLSNESAVTSVVQQTDGKLVVAGYANGMPTGQDFVVVRYESGQLDTDSDGYVDGLDNCLAVSNADQFDTDDDGFGNACDSDSDNDGVPDISDIFPLDPTETTDTDGDNLGDNNDQLPNNASTLNDFLRGMKAEKIGSAAAFAGDFNGDGYGDYVVGTPRYDIPADQILKMKTKKDVGRAEVISGKNGSVLVFLNGTAAKNALGTAVAGGSDIDHDGYDDVVIGAPNAGVTHAGSVTILYGRALNATRSNIVIEGSLPKSAFGTAVALGDVDGDDHIDILVGAPKDDDTVNKHTDAGSVTVYSGQGFVPLTTPFYGASVKAHAGTAVAAGDVDYDGVVDIVIGAPDDDDGAVKDSGSVTAYSAAGTLLMQKYGAKKSQFGKAVATGDVNDDGYADVLVGAPLDDDADNKHTDAGSITVFSGNAGIQLAKQYGATVKASLGYSVAAGDVNGDGKADLIAGARKDDKPTDNPKQPVKDSGSVSVWSGNGYTQITTLYGATTKDYFGSAVSAGDINSDGKADIIIGIPGFDVSTKIKDAGKVTVVNGAAL